MRFEPQFKHRDGEEEGEATFSFIDGVIAVSARRRCNGARQ